MDELTWLQREEEQLAFPQPTKWQLSFEPLISFQPLKSYYFIMSKDEKWQAFNQYGINVRWSYIQWKQYRSWGVLAKHRLVLFQNQEVLQEFLNDRKEQLKINLWRQSTAVTAAVFMYK